MEPSVLYLKPVSSHDLIYLSTVTVCIHSNFPVTQIVLQKKWLDDKSHMTAQDLEIDCHCLLFTVY